MRSKSGCAPFVFFTDHRSGSARGREHTGALCGQPKGPYSRGSRSRAHSEKRNQKAYAAKNKAVAWLILFSANSVDWTLGHGSAGCVVSDWEHDFPHERCEKIMRRFWSLWQSLAAPSLACHHQMASAPLLVPARLGPGLRMGKPIIWQ